ncbi:MAG: hypothetical protein IJ446_03920 [Oscillospiraceae bacterium]|nr:hypothetical protein [Oscillospiraceae bacterium]
MKTLKEIQQELEELIQKVKNISADIAEYEEATRPVDDSSIDFEEVKLIAKSRLYKNHVLADQDDSIREKYLTVLFSALFGENLNVTDALAHIFKIGYSSGYSGDMKGLYAKGLGITPAELNNCIKDIRGTKLAEVLAADMLIVTEKYLSDKETSRRYVSKMISLLGLDSEQADFVISFAKVIITEDISGYKSERRFLDDEYSCYISDSAVIRKAVKKARKVFYLHIRQMFGDCSSGIRYYSNWDYVHKITAFWDLKNYKINDKNMISVRFSTEDTEHESFGLYTYFFRYEFLIKFNISDDMPLELHTGDMAVSFIPAAGYYHSNFDIQSLCTEWYEKQPKTDPIYSELTDGDREKLANEENWTSNYELSYIERKQK